MPTTVREGSPSLTAARVAAIRLGLDRRAAAFGDPASEERIAADVAADLTSFEPSAHMRRYLQARTAFFDQVVLQAIDRDVTQLLLVGAGYDGRALRYARPGVRWFEVDHPTTQADKRKRLARLGIDATNIDFIAVDLRHGGLAPAMLAAGLKPDAPVQILCEGVGVYLEQKALEDLMMELRALASPGTRLAMSTSVARPADGGIEREQFAERVASVGESVMSVLGADSVAELFEATRWRRVDMSELSRGLGFVVGAPVWRSAALQAPPTMSRIGAYLDRTFHRDGVDTLANHLHATYGVDVARLHRLDVGVYRADPADGQRWIARRRRPARRFAHSASCSAGSTR